MALSDFIWKDITISSSPRNRYIYLSFENSGIQIYFTVPMGMHSLHHSLHQTGKRIDGNKCWHFLFYCPDFPHFTISLMTSVYPLNFIGPTPTFHQYTISQSQMYGTNLWIAHKSNFERYVSGICLNLFIIYWEN